MELIDNLIKERASLAKRLEAIDVLLESYGSFNVAAVTAPARVDDDFPNGYLNQVAYIIKKENRFLHNKEITSILKEYHPDKDIEFLKRRISSVITKAKEADGGNITSIRVGKSLRNTFWGSKDWLDENGKPFKEHMYDTKMITMVRTTGIRI